MTKDELAAKLKAARNRAAAAPDAVVIIRFCCGKIGVPLAACQPVL